MQPAHLVSRSSSPSSGARPHAPPTQGSSWSSRALELYGTAIGTWRWAEELPGLGIPDGNPPSGVASGYVWFDVMALLLVPRLLALVDRTWPSRRRPVPGIGQV